MLPVLLACSAGMFKGGCLDLSGKGKENRFCGWTGVGRDGNSRDGERMKLESTGKDNWNVGSISGMN